MAKPFCYPEAYFFLHKASWCYCICPKSGSLMCETFPRTIVSIIAYNIVLPFVLLHHKGGSQSVNPCWHIPLSKNYKEAVSEKMLSASCGEKELSKAQNKWGARESLSEAKYKRRQRSPPNTAWLQTEASLRSPPSQLKDAEHNSFVQWQLGLSNKGITPRSVLLIKSKPHKWIYCFVRSSWGRGLPSRAGWLKSKVHRQHLSYSIIQKLFQNKNQKP